MSTETSVICAGLIERGHVALNDLQFSARELIRDGRYLSLDNFAAVKTDSDA